MVKIAHHCRDRFHMNQPDTCRLIPIVHCPLPSSVGRPSSTRLIVPGGSKGRADVSYLATVTEKLAHGGGRRRRQLLPDRHCHVCHRGRHVQVVHVAIRPGVTRSRPLRRMFPNARSHRHSCGEASSPDTTNAYEHTSIHVGLGMFG